MNPDRPHRDENSVSDQQLDQLLASAEVPTQSRRQRRALRRWLKTTLRDTRPSRWPSFRLAAGLACIILVVLGMWRVIGWSSDAPKPITDNSDMRIDSEPPPTQTKPARRHRSKNRQPRLTRSIQRLSMQIASSEVGLNFLEQFSITLDRSTHQARQERDRERWRQLRPLLDWRQEFEEQLANQLKKSDHRSFESIQANRKKLQLLSCIASPRSLPLVQSYVSDPVCHSRVVKATTRIANANQIGQLALHIDSIDSQGRLLAELLNRGDPASFQVYLSVTGKLNSFSVVQSSAAHAKSLPVDLLFQALQSNRIRIGRVAATLLSTLDAPAISHNLQQLALQPETSRAAIFALAARTDEPSIRFIHRASEDLRFRALVRNEIQTWNRLISSQTVSTHFRNKPHSTP